MSNAYTTLPLLQSGWCYSHSGRPVAYLVEPGRPETTEAYTFENWWDALHFAVIYATVYPRCEYIGGPSDE